MKATSTTPYMIGALSSAIVFAPAVVASGSAAQWDAMLPSHSGSVQDPKLGLIKNPTPSQRATRQMPILPFDWDELDDVDDRLPPILPMKTVGTVRMIPGKVVPAPILPFDWSELDDIDEVD